ncbi:MAG: hypothetical protein HZA13_00040 [Nitrospirae bacterium]|nr:hypothetical protein [Nitrospirota bacterium]
MHSRKLVLSSLFFMLLFFVLQACGPVTSHYVTVEDNLLRGDAASADAVVQKNRDSYGERNEVLYDMDRGMTLHLAGRYQESNQILEDAEQRIEDLFTKRVTTEAAAFLTNDNLLPYEGEDFEKVMINMVRALNYMYLGDTNNALVEARKVDQKLNLINDKYADKKNAYKEDAFARYLAGILYEAGGKQELNEAWISYRKSMETFKEYAALYKTPIPTIVVQDVMRLTDALGQQDMASEIKKEFPNIEWRLAKDLKGQGELIFLSYNGRAPRKEDNFLDIPLSPEAIAIVLATGNKNNDVKTAARGIAAIQGQVVRIALPKFIPQRSDVAYAEVSLTPQGGGPGVSGRTVLMEDITAIAMRNLDDRILRITAKAVARAAVKKLIALTIEKKAEKEGGALAGMILGGVANAAGFATEQADKRSWRTLPDEIQVVRIGIPPGTYDLQVKYIARNGLVIDQKVFHNILIKAGEKKFMSNRIVR